MQLGRQPAPRTPQRVIVGLGRSSAGRFGLLIAVAAGSGRVLMGAQDGGVHTDLPADQPGSVGSLGLPCARQKRGSKPGCRPLVAAGLGRAQRNRSEHLDLVLLTEGCRAIDPVGEVVVIGVPGAQEGVALLTLGAVQVP